MEPLESPLFSLVRRVRQPLFSSLICAHRGDSQNAPENTISAFKRAIDGQSDMIEMDIRETKDGLIAVIHDSKVDRTTNGAGEVKKFTFAELQKLDAGSWFDPAFAHEKIPSLDEFLELVKGNLIPMIEIKDSFKKSPKLSTLLIEKLKDHQMLSDVIVAVTGKKKQRTRSTYC